MIQKFGMAELKLQMESYLDRKRAGGMKKKMSN